MLSIEANWEEQYFEQQSYGKIKQVLYTLSLAVFETATNKSARGLALCRKCFGTSIQLSGFTAVIYITLFKTVIISL